MNKRAVIGIICAISTLFAFNGSAFTFADEGVGFSIDVSEAALQLTAPETATIELNPISSAAVFNSTSFNVNVATNNMTGYTLTMSVATTDLTHNTLTNTVIPTLSAASTEANFPVNAWGYKITGDSYNPVLLTNSSPSWTVYNPTNSQDHIITLGASVDGSKESGTYTNTLTFNVVANPVANRDTVSFNKNNENATGTMSDQVLFQDGSSVLDENAFELDGMKIIGWSTTPSGTGDTRYYGDESIYTSPNPGANNTVTLYAQWAPASTPTPSGSTPSGSTPTGTTFARAYEIAYTAQHKGMYEKDESDGGDGKYHLINSWPPYDETYHGYDVRFAMQDMTPEICASVTAMHDDYQALDIRDDKLYHITKLKDGNCWMTQNLDLDVIHVDDSADIKYDHSNTDIGWGSDKTITKWNPDRSTLPSSEISSDGKYTWLNGNINYSLDPGDWYGTDTWYSSGTYNYLDTEHNGAGTRFSQNPFPGNGTHGHVGNYYKWATAIASNVGSTYGNTISDISTNPQNSICPAGWRLPYITNNYGGDFKTIVDIYNNTSETVGKAFMSAPLWFVRGGLAAFSSGLSSPGVEGHYWSSTSYSTEGNAYLIYQTATSIGLNTMGSKGDGRFIRCLAR